MGSKAVTELARIEEWMVQNNVAGKEIFVLATLVFLSLLVIFAAKKYRVPIVVGYVFLGILLSKDIIEWLPFLSEAQKE